MADKLSYDFEINAKTDGLDKANATLGKAEASMKGVDAAAKSTAGHLGKVGDAAQEAGHKVSMFWDIFSAEVAKDALEGIAEKLIDIGKEAVNAAAKAERLDLSFTLTLGQEGAEDILGWIEKISGKTEFTDDALKGWGLQLANAGVKGEQLKDIMAAALDVAGKRGPEAMGMAVDALTRASLSGKIEGRALRGLGIPVADLAQLSQFKGLNEKQINKKLETTEVTKDDLLKLIAGADKLLGDKGVKAADTLGAKMLHLKDLPDQFFQKLAKTAAFDQLSGAADRLLEKLNPDSPAGQKIFGALEKAFGGIVEVIDKIDVGEKVELLVSALTGLGKIVGPVLKALYHDFEGIAYVIGRITGSMKSADEQKKEMAQKEQNAKASIALMNLAGDNLGADTLPKAEFDKVKAMFSSEAALKDAVVRMKSHGQELGAGLIEGMIGKVPEVADAASKVASTPPDVTAKELKIHSPSEVFKDLGQMTVAGFTAGIRSGQGALDTTMGDAFAAPRGGQMAGGGPISVSVPVTVQVVSSSGDPRADGEAAGAAAARVARAEIVRFLEQQRTAQGT